MFIYCLYIWAASRPLNCSGPRRASGGSWTSCTRKPRAGRC